MSTPPPPSNGYPGQDAGGYPQQSPGYPAQPQGGYPAPGAYPAQPQGGYPVPGAYPPPPVRAPRPKGSPTLGIIAAVAAIAGIVIGSVLVGVSGAQLGSFVSDAASSTTDPSMIDEDEFVPFLLGVFAGFGVYSVLAIWGLVQGIVATVLNRGRGWGIAAIVIAVLGIIPVMIVWAATFLTAIPSSGYSY